MYTIMINAEIHEFLHELENRHNMQQLVKSVNWHLELLKAAGWICGCTRKLEAHLWELKVQKVRIIYCVIKNAIHILRCFVKSTPRTPLEVLKVARNRYYALRA